MPPSVDAVSSPPHMVMIVDDHFVVRNGLAAAFEVEADIAVIAEADSGKEALALYSRQRPDAVLLDLQLPDIAGPDLVAALRALDPTARILIFSAYARDDELKAVMDAGASGFVQKTAPRDELLTALRRVAAGGRFLAADLQQRIKALRSGPAITPREREVLACIARGLSNKEIASRLGISFDTVKQHISSVLDKLEVKDRAEAATEAIRRGLITLPR